MKAFDRFVCKLFLPGLASITLFNGCIFLPSFERPVLSGNRAFIAYWPPPDDNTQLKLAVKDNIDMQGVVTTAGSELFASTAVPAAKDAACLSLARQRNVLIVGKANLSEFAVAPSGYNEYFGTPPSPLNKWRRLLPGGSSSGSAVAVATGMADVAFGTDTAGSIRVPAAWCGVVGLKTTHGLVPLEGVFPIEPQHLDTVGPMAKDIAGTVRGMDLLQEGFAARYAAAVAARPSARQIRIGRLIVPGTDCEVDQAVDEALVKTGFQVIVLDDAFREKWEQATEDGNTLATAGAWMSDKDFRLDPRIGGRTRTAIRAGLLAYQTGYEEALARQAEWRNTLREIFTRVDFIALPTLKKPPLPIPPNLRIGVVEARMLKLQNTVAVNFAGNPALAVPIPLHYPPGLTVTRRMQSPRSRESKDRPMHDAKVPVTSLELIGPPLSEAQLLNAGRLVEAAVKDERTDLTAP